MMNSSPPVAEVSADAVSVNHSRARYRLLIKWAIVIGSGLAIAIAPVPSGITSDSWYLLAIFIATIVGSIVRPLPGGAIVLLGIAAVILTRVLVFLN